MGLFARPGATVARNFHSYITEEPTLHNIGLASYTRNSLEKFGKKRKSGIDIEDPDIQEYFGGAIPKPALLGDNANLSILKFDKDNKRYVLRTSTATGEDSIWWSASGDGATAANNLKEFQENFDLLQKGFLNDSEKAERTREVWTNIQTSLSGCITFTVPYTVLSCQKTSLTKIYFQSAGKSSTDRGVAQKGSPIIAGTPRRATGQKYSDAGSREAPNGVYIPEREGGNNNPENATAGEMRMSYDPATGKWESGTQQMMFRLLTDIDGVPAVDLPNNVDDVDIESFYSGPLSSKFVIGTGMPVSTENGNPYLFGPNSNGCGPSPKEKVLMVNRTPRSYVKGEIVLGSLINGEWIPMGFGLPKTVSRQMNVEWSQIQKYIVDAKSYFRNASDTSDVTPEKYANHLRFKFYTSLESMSNAPMLSSSGNDLNKLALINLVPKNVTSYTIDKNGAIVLKTTIKENITDYNLNMNLVPSTGYLQFFDADVIKTSLCGNNDNSRLRKTNIKQTTPDYEDSGDILAENVPSSWGLYFPDGYSTASVSRLKNIDDGFTTTLSAMPSYNVYTSSQIDFSSAANGKFDVSDINLYHLPAQIALNAVSNQSIVSDILWIAQSTKGSYADALIRYFKAPFKGDWVKTNTGKDVFKLSPVNSTSVQFTPLSLPLALCSTVIPNNSTAADAGGYLDLKLNLDFQGWNKTAFGKAWERLKLPDAGFLLGTSDTTRGNIGFGNRLLKITNGIITIDKPDRSDTVIDGGPGILPKINGKELSNVVGILAAKATINMSAGGQLELRTTNNFGLNAYGVVGGGAGSLSFIPTLFGLVPGADGRSEIKKYDNVQWGSSSNNDDIKAFGTTSLWCKIYDHCPSAIYDARYFTPLQFHGDAKDLSGASLDFEIPAKQVGATKTALDINTKINIDFTDKITSIKNPIRRNMLLTGGGFYYIKRVIGVDTDGIQIITKDGDVPTGYEDGDIVKFVGGSKPAIFKAVTSEGKIMSVEPDSSLGIDAYGEFSFSNPFRDGPLEAQITSSKGGGQTIKLTSLKVIEKVAHDNLQSYNEKVLTPPDNNGAGNDAGYVTVSKSTTFSLEPNSTGKYDIFLFFVNDIANYPENSMGANGQLGGPYAQYVNLEISAN